MIRTTSAVSRARDLGPLVIVTNTRLTSLPIRSQRPRRSIRLQSERRSHRICVARILTLLCAKRQKQPSMILFAINQLVSSLAEVIGAEEATGKAIIEGWAQDADEETLDQWRAAGISYGEDVETAAMRAFRTEYKRLYAKVSVLKRTENDASKPS